MNGQEKSHSAIVAEKPTNGAGQPAEEPVEPRAGAEGNASQQSAFLDSVPGRRVTGAGAHTASGNIRFAVNHPRQEPDALIGPVRIGAGGVQQWTSLPR